MKNPTRSTRSVQKSSPRRGGKSAAPHSMLAFMAGGVGAMRSAARAARALADDLERRADGMSKVQGEAEVRS